MYTSTYIYTHIQICTHIYIHIIIYRHVYTSTCKSFEQSHEHTEPQHPDEARLSISRRLQSRQPFDSHSCFAPSQLCLAVPSRPLRHPSRVQTCNRGPGRQHCTSPILSCGSAHRPLTFDIRHPACNQYFPSCSRFCTVAKSRADPVFWRPPNIPSLKSAPPVTWRG